MEDYLKDEINLLYNHHDAVIIMYLETQTYKIIYTQQNYFSLIETTGHWNELFAYEYMKFPRLADLNLPPLLLSQKQRKIHINLENDTEKYYLTLLHVPEKKQYICFVDEIYNVLQLTPSVEQQYENTRLINMLTVFARNLFFRYEPAKQTFTFYEDILLTQPKLKITVDELVAEELVKPDEEIFLKLVDSMNSGKLDTPEFRMKFRYNQYTWYRVHYDITFDKNNMPIGIFGIIKNIDTEVKYRNKSECDLLTGLYNKLTCEKKIESLLKNEGLILNGYLIFIDVDNFKAVNDNLGHNFGDTVLISLADSLKTLFRNDDIVGRIGGDEFMVFAKGFESEATLIQRLEQVNQAFHNIYYDEFTEYEISSSIGVSMYPRDGRTFKEIAERADIAMYKAKKEGKNQFVIYSPNLSSTESSIVINHFDTMKRTSAQFIDIELCFNLFEFLYNVNNPLVELNKVISILGSSYDIDRFYIFRVDHTLGLLLNQFEWLSDKSNLPYMPYTIIADKVKPITDRYDEGGIFYLDAGVEYPQEFWDAMPYPGIKSMLHCSVKIEENISITVGYDRYEPQMRWNQKTINTLIFLAKIVSIYVC